MVYGYPAIALPLHHIEVICQIIPADSPWILVWGLIIVMAVFRLSTSGFVRPGFAVGFSLWYRKNGGWVSLRRSVSQSLRAVLTIIKRSWTMRPRNPGQSSRNHCPYESKRSGCKTCLSDQAIKFIRNVGFYPLELGIKAEFGGFADTGIHGNTREAIQRLKPKGRKFYPISMRLVSWPSRWKSSKNEWSNKPRTGSDYLSWPLESRRGQLWKADHLVAVALKKMGPWGAKMSGGGLGGCVIALVKDSREAATIAHALEKKERTIHGSKPVKAKSYANIAIIKYWGKKMPNRSPSDQFDFVDPREYDTRDGVSLPYQQMRLRMNFYIDGNSKIQLEQAKIELWLIAWSQQMNADLFGWIPATTCQLQPVCPLAQAASLLSSRLAISTMIWAWVRRN